VRPGGIEGVRIRVANSGRRAAIVRLAARALKALRALLDFAPPALCAADGLDRTSRDPCPGNYRRPEQKCLTTVGSGATV
jgi:hypothetical protein